MRLRALLAFALGCSSGDITVTHRDVDNDGDGYTAEVDCDDAHATVNPDAPEACDGVDNDCDGVVDEDVADAVTAYTDADGDGFGDPATEATVCELGSGQVAEAGDCDDSEAAVHPAAVEVCNGVDDDCDGGVDTDATDAPTGYTDADGDGYGDPTTAETGCELPDILVPDGTDCDDADSATHPDAAEADCADPVDYNCDGSVAYADTDGDGWAACEECDDGDALRNPALPEVCDTANVDEDCSGAADDDDTATDAETMATWTRDADGDGYGADGGLTRTACDEPLGYAAAAGDCDDLAAAVNPGATEVCDAGDTDEDCDGTADDADASTDAGTWSAWYADADGDAYGDASASVSQCDPPAGWVGDATDCDDTAGGTNPGAAEVCDAADTDEDCDGLADDADTGPAGTTRWYADTDGDTYGDAASVTAACDVPAGHVADATDCDDGAAAVNPGAAEVCDAADTDEDCDGLADDADSGATGTTSWYADVDGDSYGDAAAGQSACDAPAAHVADSTDCDDGAPASHPAGTEVCGGDDEDCDGLTDDDDPSVTGTTTWYADADGDAYGDAATTSAACVVPAGFAGDATDCDDAATGVNPGAAEVCDAADTDEDCDGAADDADPEGATGGTTLYADTDGDGYGDPTAPESACGTSSGLVADATDCDDGDSGVSPAEAEVCGNSTDDDCDGTVDDGCPYSGTSAAEGSGGDADYLVYGYESGAEFGAALASGVDLDGDGDDEWIVGSPGARYAFTTTVDYNGAAYNARLPTSAEASIDSIRRGRSYGPTATGVEYGARVWAVNDVDEDGYDEYAVFYDSSSASSDVVWLVDGGASATSSSYNGGSFHHSGYFCDNISGAGTSDSATTGYNLLLGNTEYSSYKGIVYHYTGVSGTTSIGSGTGEAASDYAGSGLGAGPGNDVDGDGLDDLFVGAPGYGTTGAVYTFLASYRGGNMAYADSKLTSGTGADFGTAIAPAGDVDGDGLADIAVGVPGAGYVMLFQDMDPSGSTVDTTSASGVDAYFSGTGYALGRSWDGSAFSFGDVDGDGVVDALISSAYYDNGTTTNVGAAWLVYGPLSGSYNLASASAWDARFTGDSTNDYCGWSSALGDLDADGLQDLLVGCPGGDTSTLTDYGVVAIFMGR